MSQMRVLHSDQLFIDPDVQLAFAVKESHWRKIAANWDDNRVGFLIVVPNGTGAKFSICDGRHRFLGGSAKGVTTWRCDIHDEVAYEDIVAKARLKLGFDYDRRHVGSLEHFHIRVKARDPIAVAMNETIEACGFRVASNTGSSETSRRLSCVTALERYYLSLGADKFKRLMQLNTHWLDTVGANNGEWIGGLALLVRDGYDEAITPTVLPKLREIVPNLSRAHAKGKVVKQGGSLSTGSGEKGFNAIHYEIAKYIRRKSGLRQRPVVRKSPRDVRSRSI